MGNREYQTPPEQLLGSALATVSSLPQRYRDEATRRVAEEYRSLYAEMGLPVPTWVAMLDAAAGPHASSDAWLVLCALHTLSEIPHERIVEAMRSLAAVHRSLYRRMGLPVASWILLLESTADVEEASPTNHESEMLVPLPFTSR